MRRFLIVAAVLVPLPAAAYDEKRENALNHLADAIAVAERCSTLELNGSVSTAAMVFFDLDAIAPADLASRTGAHVKNWAGYDLTCITGKVLYGPRGTSVPGLLRYALPD